MKTHDYATVICFPGRGNKRIKRTASGLQKEAGVPMQTALAHTVHIPDVSLMGELLGVISENHHLVLVLGFVPGTEPAPDRIENIPFRMASEGWITARSPTARENIQGWHEINGERVIARLKRNMLPSTWTYFDRDAMPDMPAHLSRLDTPGWLDAMEKMVPGFKNIGRVEVPSTTGRVLVDGTPMAATGSHLYFQIQDPYDLGRFGTVLLQRSFLNGLGFMRPWGESVRQWSIFDPSVFSHERLIYDGKPMVDGEGLTVAPPNITMTAGESLDTRTLKDLTPMEAEKVHQATGSRIQLETRKQLRMTAEGAKHVRVLVAMTVDDQKLKPTTTITAKIDNKTIKITLLEYWASDHGKLRCQTPFRSSTSWNGILNRHQGRGAAPFLFDNGSRMKYVLNQEDIATHRVDV